MKQPSLPHVNGPITSPPTTPPRLRVFKLLAAPILGGIAAGLAIDCLYFAALLAVEPIPSGAGDLLVGLWMGLFFIVAPGVAAAVAAIASRQTPLDHSVQGATREEAKGPPPTAKVAATVAGVATFLVALALLLMPLLGQVVK
jgi:hypothetical protein